MNEVERLRQVDVFRDLSDEVFERVCSLADFRDLGAGQLIFEDELDDGRSHVLIDGAAELIAGGEIENTVFASDESPGSALDPKRPRTHSARTPTGATIASFDREALGQLLAELDPTPNRKNATGSDWMVRMLQSDLFSRLPVANTQKVFSSLEPVEYTADQVVVNQGSDGDFYYVVESGYCEVSRSISAGRGQIHLANLGPGDAFGEEALIANRARSATVTMISGGRLMRLSKRKFKALIQDELLHAVSVDDALSEIAANAVWLDIRNSDDFRTRCLHGSENIPFNIIRVESGRLRNDLRYIVCADDVDQGAIAAFLLATRGLDVAYLAAPIETVIVHHPELATNAEAMRPASIVYLHNATDDETESNIDDVVVKDVPTDSPFADTIARIASLSTHEEAKRQMQQMPELDRLAQTTGGRALAELLTELSEQHEALANGSNGVTDITSTTERAVEPGSDASFSDSLAPLLGEMTERLRDVLETALDEQVTQMEAEYQSRLAEVKASLENDLKRKESALAERLVARYQKKEQLLRSNYKKVVAFANRLSQQKQKVRKAQQKVAARMRAADKLYRDITQMRALLEKDVADLPEAQGKRTKPSA